MRSALVKRDPARAAALRGWLESREGVERVDMNPVTGSVLIHYRAGAVNGTALIAELREGKWIAPPEGQSRPAPLEHAVAKTLLKFAAEAAIERSVLALAAALL